MIAAHAPHHAKDRGRERLGLKGSSVERMAQIAVEKGLKPEDTSGQLLRYLQGKLADRPETGLRIYGEVVFVFGRNLTLITCWQLPREFRATVKKIKKAKQA